MSRLAERFAKLRSENRAALVTYFMAGDPDRASFEALLGGLPAAGADIIEVGIPFSDPMADGPAIQAAGLRAIAAGTKLTDGLGDGRTVSPSRCCDADYTDGLFQPDLSLWCGEIPGGCCGCGGRWADRG